MMSSSSFHEHVIVLLSVTLVLLLILPGNYGDKQNYCERIDIIRSKNALFGVCENNRGSSKTSSNLISHSTNDKIKDSSKDKDAEHVWNVAIQTIVNFGASISFKSFLCGGVLVNPYVVLSSASCFDDLLGRDICVRDGVNEILPTVKSIKVHPNYTKGSYYNDIALVKLRVPFKARSNLIADPSYSKTEVDDLLREQPDFEAFVTDWNINEHLANEIIHTLPQVEYTIKQKSILKPALVVNGAKCESQLRNYYTNSRKNFNDHFPRGIDATLVCAHLNGDLENKQRNRGYQLVMQMPSSFNNANDSKYLLIGTRVQVKEAETSHSDSEKVKYVPGIYTNIYAHHKWIASVLDSM